MGYNHSRNELQEVTSVYVPPENQITIYPDRCTTSGMPVLLQQSHRERFLLLIIFLFACTIRFSYLLEIKDNPYFNNPIVDAQTYDDWARHIIEGSPEAQKIFWQAPLYPYFLSLVYRITSHTYLTVRIIQFVLGAFNCILLFLITKKVCPPAAVLATFIAALYGPFIFFEGELLAPVILVTLYLLLAITLIHADHQQKIHVWFMSGLVNGLTALAHGVALILLPFICVWMYVRRRREERIRHIVTQIGFYLAGCFVIVGLITLRNYYAGHELVLISSNVGLNFYLGNNPEYEYTVNLRPGNAYDRLTTEPDSLGIQSDSAQSRYFLDKALACIRQQPYAYLKLLAHKAFLLLQGNEISRNQDIYAFRRFSSTLSLLLWKNIIAFPFGLLAPLALMGMAASWKERKNFLLFYLIIGGHCIGTILFFIASRYRIPVIPFLALFAAYFIWTAYRKIINKEYPSLISSICILLCLTALCNYQVGSMSEEDFPDSYCALANQYMRKGQMEEAVTYLKKALTIDPSSASAHFNLGYAYRIMDRLDESIAEYKRAISIDPSDTEAHFNLGAVYMEQLRLDEAGAAFGQVLTRNAAHPKAHHMLGLIFAQENKNKEAIAEFEQAIAINPTDAQLHYHLGTVYQNLNRTDDAITSYEQALLIQHDLLEASCSLGMAYQQKGMVDKALACYQRVLAINPHIPEIHNRAGLLYNKKAMPDEALQAFKQALAIKPDYAEAEGNLATIYMQQGLLDEAIAHYEKALAINPNLAGVHYNLALAYFAKEMFDEAIARYQKALLISPNFIEAHNNLGQAYYAKGMFNDAITQYKKALAISPNLPEVYYNLGLAYYKKSDYSLAGAHFEKALALGYQVEPELLESVNANR